MPRIQASCSLSVDRQYVFDGIIRSEVQTELAYAWCFIECISTAYMCKWRSFEVGNLPSQDEAVRAYLHHVQGMYFKSRSWYHAFCSRLLHLHVTELLSDI
jgi:hypothetical protein